MTLVCPITEARILAACIVRRDVFEYLADFEVEHFAVPQHRVAFASMRRLQAIGEPTDVLAICDEIEMRDLETGSRAAEKVNAAWMAELMLSTSNYTEEILFDRDVEWLRTLAQRRRSLERL